MSEQPELVREVARWIEKAENDLRNAECVINIEEDCPYDTVCYHCHQCVEKYIKALLIYRKIHFPRTHDLVVLLNALGEKSLLSLHLHRIQPLNRYSIEARYPGDWDPIGRNEATEALVVARAVRDAIRSKLKAIL